MNYLTNSRREIMRWLEDNKAITIKQCANMFFQHTKDEENAYKRSQICLNEMEKACLITSYYCEEDKEDRKFKVYVENSETKISYHSLLRLNFISKLIYMGAEVVWKPIKLYNDIIRPDAFIVYRYEGQVNDALFLEVDWGHETEIKKLRKYDTYFATGEAEKRWGFKPKLVIMKKNITTMFEPKNFDLYYIPFTLDDTVFSNVTRCYKK